MPGALEVLAAAAAGDPDAVRIWDDALRALAEQLARLVAILAPEAVVIGGGLAQAGPALFEPLGERLDALLSFHRRPALLPARLGDDAGLLGTALAARDLADTLAAADQTVILTVTPNPALDLTWHVDALTPGATHRAPTGAGRAGGKGLNVARVLHAQGHEVLALATVGGPNGAEFASELQASGIPHRLIPVDAPTRRSLAIVDDARGETTVVNELGAALAPAEAASSPRPQLDSAARPGRSRSREACRRASGRSSSVQLVAELVGAGIPVVVDTSGAGLLAAARAGASALKPNHEELEDRHRSRPTRSWGRASLLALGARLVVVSLGRDGLLVVDRADAPLHARLPRALHGNPTGAGDAAVAAITAALATGPSLDGRQRGRRPRA